MSTLISAGASGTPEARESEAEGGLAPKRRASYARYVIGKVLGSLGSLFFVLVVNFFLFRVIPGDPARTLGRGRFRTAGAARRVQARRTASTSRCRSSS